MIGAFLGRLFGGDKAGAAIVDSVSNGIDKIWYTAEEKAEATAQARTEGFAVYMEWLKSTSGSRIARRWIAMLVTGIWAIEHITAVIFSQIAVFINDLEKISKFIEASDRLFSHASNNNTLVGVVLLFYFGGPAASVGIGAMVEKWTQGKQPNAR
ncbi:MAG: hypothetical protein GY928_39605 [Colwellia sp.]|nr:hypothetical protein [Colwellia sp.]